MKRVWLLASLALVLMPLLAAAQQPDWTAIEYPGGTGCGLYVQFFTADGWEPAVNGTPSAFFPGGAPPSTSEPECLAKCRDWAQSSSVRTLAAGYRKSYFITQVRGTCYLQRRALAPPGVIEVP